jgi:hypothetical protein
MASILRNVALGAVFGVVALAGCGPDLGTTEEELSANTGQTTCGPGQLHCESTHSCYRKSDPTACGRCTRSAQCGPSAVCCGGHCIPY